MTLTRHSIDGVTNFDVLNLASNSKDGRQTACSHYSTDLYWLEIRSDIVEPSTHCRIQGQVVYANEDILVLH